MLNLDVILRLIRDIEDVKLFSELYYDLSKRKLDSEDDVANAKLKMNFCKDKVIAVSHYVDEQFRDLNAKQMNVGNAMDAIGKLGEQTRILENAAMKKLALKGKMESLFEEYRKGRFTFFQYTEMKMRILQGKTQEQWEDLLEGTMYDSLTKIKPLNKLIFNALYSEDRHELLRIEAEPARILDDEVESVPESIVPTPTITEPKKGTVKPIFELKIPKPPEYISTLQKKPVQLPAIVESPVEGMIGAKEIISTPEARAALPEPPAPQYHEQEERRTIEKLHEVALTNPNHGAHHDTISFDPREIAAREKEAEVEKEESRKEIIPKVVLPQMSDPVEEDVETPTGSLAEPLDDNDPYVRWLVDSGREEEEDRIDRLISELKSQPIETEAKIKVVQELTTKLEKIKEKKQESKPLDPRMLEESVDEYEF